MFTYNVYIKLVTIKINLNYGGIMTDILDKITYFREINHWTEYQLAKYSGLTQSTISSWYRKDILPSLTSLCMICKAFDISLSQFFACDSNDPQYLDYRQTLLLKMVSELSNDDFDYFLALLSFFIPKISKNE